MFKKIIAGLWLASVSKRKDVEMFWSSEYLPLEHLFGDQIIAVLGIIDAELLKSFEFGLKISRKDIIKEKVVVLKFLNAIGNLGAMPGRLTFEAAKTIFFDFAYEALADEVKFYFEKAKEGEVKNKYNCHLEAVVVSILRSIYSPDGRIPYVGGAIKNK